MFTFSRHLKREVAARYDLNPERVHFAPVGSEHWERELKAGAARPSREPGPPELLVLGAVRASRLPLDVLAGFEALRAGGTQAQLVFCGRPGNLAGPFRRAVDASPVGADVRWIEDPIEADMPQLVANATVLVHLATDEGSPVTPLEACRLGPALVLSDLPALREALCEAAGAALNDVARWVPRRAEGDGPLTDLSAQALADQLAAGLADGADPVALARRRQIAAPFTWDACAAVHIQTWERILGASPPPASRPHVR